MSTTWAVWPVWTTWPDWFGPGGTTLEGAVAMTATSTLTVGAAVLTSEGHVHRRNPSSPRVNRRDASVTHVDRERPAHVSVNARDSATNTTTHRSPDRVKVRRT